MPIEIRQIEPGSARDALIDLFWEHRHWPGRTRDEYRRLWDWRYRWLADGEPWAWVACEDGAVVGHIAVFPRRFRFGEEELRGAVSGDLLVRQDRRHTLLGVQLLRKLQHLVNQGALDFVMALPNAISYRLSMRLGYHDLGVMQDHVDLRRAEPVLCRRFSYPLAVRALSRLATPLWGWRRHVLQRRLRGYARSLHVELLEQVDASRFDRGHWRAPPDRLVAWDSLEYIVGRFLRDPLNRRSFYTLRDPHGDRMQGYVVVEFRNGRAIVCECRTNALALHEPEAIACTAPHLPPDTEVLVVPTLPQTRLAAELRALGFLRRPLRAPSEGVRVTALWNSAHPLAAYLERRDRWNLYPGAADA